MSCSDHESIRRTYDSAFCSRGPRLTGIGATNLREMRPHASSRGTRRITKACARCRSRKIKCDFSYPTCASCASVNIRCTGYDAVEGTERPRSTTAHLEKQIALLEVELKEIESSRPPNTSESVSIAVNALTRRLAEIIANPVSPEFLSQGPVPPFGGDFENSSTLLARSQSTNIALVPKKVIDILLKNYCSIYLLQYPAVEEQDLYASCDRIFSSNSPSHYDIFTVAITLAISLNTLIRYDEQRAVSAAAEFWTTAVESLQHIGDVPWESLQALLLLSHFGLLSPSLVNCSNCAAAATRLCMQLGLHHELPESERIKVAPEILNKRRRLFWMSYSTDAAIHSILRRPFVWPRHAITAEFPHYETQLGSGINSSTTGHTWLFRKLEAEVTLTMYHPSTSNIDNVEFNSWFIDINNRLDQWYKEVNENRVLADKIEFYETHYRSQIFRCNRITPRCPWPTKDMRVKAIHSALVLIAHFSKIQQQGRLFYNFHLSHYLVEFGLSLLETIAVGLDAIHQKPSHLNDFDLLTLSQTVQSIPLILRKMARRWPALYEAAAGLEIHSLPILTSLTQVIAGVSPQPIAPSSKLKLRHLLLGFKSPAADIPQPETTCRSGNSSNVILQSDIEFAVDALLNASHSPDYQAQQTSHVAAHQVTPSQITLPALQDFPRSFDMNYQLQPIHNTFQTDLISGAEIGTNITDLSLWDFSDLDIDEIFGALVEGRDVLS